MESLQEVLEVLGHEVIMLQTPGNAIDTIIEYLDSEHETISMVLVDERMPEITGRELGKRITQYDFSRALAMVMLTAQNDITYATEALTECGFDYFVWKDNFTGDNINPLLEKIENLPSIKTKRKVSNQAELIRECAERMNNSLKKGFLERFEEKIVTFNQQKNRISIERKLELQEQVLSLMAKSDGNYYDMNNFSVSGGIKLLEDGKELTTGIMSKLRLPTSHADYDLPCKKTETAYNTVYNGLAGHFKLMEDKRQGGVFALKALVAMGLLKNYSSKYPHTLKVARTEGLFTLVNDIVLEMDKAL
jgi:CheY-like chemotaxis protein